MTNRSLLLLGVAAVVVLTTWLVHRSSWNSDAGRERNFAETVSNGSPDAQNTPASQNPSASVATPNGTNLTGATVPALTPGVGVPGAGTTAATNTPTNTDSSVSPTPPNSKIEVEKVRLMIRGFHNVMGENPVGTNAEIMQALMGGNPKQAQLGPPEGQSLNAKGELVDQWGTPFFFHQLSKDAMEIRSAGPDKIMGTSDDSVSR